MGEDKGTRRFANYIIYAKKKNHFTGGVHMFSYDTVTA